MRKLLLALPFLFLTHGAQAQATATVVQTCGTPLSVLSLGQSFPLMMDITGKLCDTGSGGSSAANVASLTSPGSGAPAAGAQIGYWNGSNWVAATGTANGLSVDGSAVTQPISVSSLPLPTGAATATLQSTGNATLTTINTSINSAVPSGTNAIGSVAPIGVANVTASSTASCGTSDSTIVAARTGAPGTGRASVTLTNITGTSLINIGGATVTTSTGLQLPATPYVGLTLNTTSAIHCIATTTAQTISFIETY